uniref:Uncharacterized protein n=1 Tax=Romanomermis culicivorax TaxID=13658 RepID=A0A915I8G3_ROMCU
MSLKNSSFNYTCPSRAAVWPLAKFPGQRDEAPFSFAEALPLFGERGQHFFLYFGDRRRIRDIKDNPIKPRDKTS